MPSTGFFLYLLEDRLDDVLLETDVCYRMFIDQELAKVTIKLVDISIAETGLYFGPEREHTSGYIFIAVVNNSSFASKI